MFLRPERLYLFDTRNPILLGGTSGTPSLDIRLFGKSAQLEFYEELNGFRIPP